jgi:metallo-beta-lactamase family protein
MEIEFIGAAQEVTGSCHLIRIGDKQILLDCGLIQGPPKEEQRNREPFPFDPGKIDALILSHAHIDHSGRIPLLVRDGFTGPIYCHQACLDLSQIMLKDAAYLHEKDAKWLNRKRERKGLAPVEPLYTMQDAHLALGQFKALVYDKKHEILPGVSVRLRDAGHILGSAIVEVWLQEGDLQRKIVFSGDLGHRGTPILHDLSIIHEADLVLMESTYGDRLHRSWHDTWHEMREVLLSAERDKGNILIPSFAVERCQELLYLFGKHEQDWGLQNRQIFLDSPMAIEATEVYLRHSDLFDREAEAFFKTHRHHPMLPNLHFTLSTRESMALNEIDAGAIIIAGSGMCNGGRIRHHLKHNIWRRDCHVILVGFQAQGTLGRALVNGAKYIRLWGETIRVKAKIHTIGGLSAHADQDGLMYWYRQFRDRPPLVLVHGEGHSMAVLQGLLRSEAQAPVRIATPGERLDLRELAWSS